MARRVGPAWSAEEIKLGFVRFQKENGRLPTALEIDRIPYLPSSRQIQRLFGGLPNLRRMLGYADIHFGQGEYRAKIGFNSSVRGKAAEKTIKELLCKKFHPPFVHIERPVGESSKNRLDFYVFSPNGNFGVDVFTTSTLHDLSTNLNIKLLKYRGFREKLYFVLISELVETSHIELHLPRRKQPMPENFKLLTLKEFIKEMNYFQSFRNPCS